MTVYERLLELCQQKNTTITSLCLQATGNKGNLQTWKNNNGYMRSDYLLSCADILGCSADYILGRTDNPNTNPLDADFFRILLSDDGLNAIKAPLKKRIEAYGYEKLEQNTGYTLMDIKLFLTSDISVGATVNSTLDRLLIALETNVYDLIRESIYEQNVNEISFNEEIAAFGGKAAHAEQPPVISEITPPHK